MVVPLLPNSDYQTGLVALASVMAALLRREAKGGSFPLSVALNYYNLFSFSLAEDPAEIEDDLRRTYAANLQLRHCDHRPRLVGQTLRSLRVHAPQLFRSDYFRAARPRGWVALKARPSRSWGLVAEFPDPAAQGRCWAVLSRRRRGAEAVDHSLLC